MQKRRKGEKAERQRRWPTAAHAQPATTQPATTQPATAQPATTQPATTQPATTQPATAQPATARPSPHVTKKRAHTSKKTRFFLSEKTTR